MIYRIGRMDLGLEGKILFRTLPLPVLLALAPCVSAFLRRTARGLPPTPPAHPTAARGAGSARKPVTAPSIATSGPGRELPEKRREK